MKGQPEPGHDLGIGKKVDAQTAPKDPWVKHKPGIWRNTETGQLATSPPPSPPAQTPSQIAAEVEEEYLEIELILPADE
jgi:hypothetical protein